MVPSGLYVTKNFISQEVQDALMADIDSGEWRTDLKRRTQHYGSRYDYKKKRPVYDVPPITGSSPERAIYMLNPNFQILSGGRSITSVIVNEYTTKQSISAHIDSPYYGEVVMTLSLGGSTVMTFRNGVQVFQVQLDSGDAVALTGDIRHNWTHETQAVNSPGYRRISVTVRCESE